MFCHNCGKQIPDNTKFCHYCGAAQDEAQGAPASAAPPPVQPSFYQSAAQPQQTAYQSTPQPQQTAYQSAPQPQQAAYQSAPQPIAAQEQERVLAGIFGALLCSLAGVAVMVVLFKIGYVASISGIIMLVCTAWGYNHFGKVMSKKGLIISILIVILMIYEGTRLCEAIMIASYNHGDFVSIVLTEMLYYNNIFRLPMSRREYYYDLLSQQYTFAAVGIIFVVINYYRGNRAAKKK